jgi:hypothetical protein
MVIHDGNGWLGARKKYFATPDDARRSLTEAYRPDDPEMYSCVVWIDR